MTNQCHFTFHRWLLTDLQTAMKMLPKHKIMKITNRFTLVQDQTAKYGMSWTMVSCVSTQDATEELIICVTAIITFCAINSKDAVRDSATSMHTSPALSLERKNTIPAKTKTAKPHSRN